MFETRGRHVRPSALSFFSRCDAQAPRRWRWRGLTAGSAALSSNVGQRAAAEPAQRLTETLCEPVTGTGHSCISGGKKGERLVRDYRRKNIKQSPACGMTRVDGRLRPAFAPENRPVTGPRVGR